VGDAPAAGVDETADTVAVASTPPREEHPPDRLPWWRRSSILALFAFSFYVVTSFVLWGLPIGGHLASRHMGMGGNDVRIYLWAMEWTPHAIASGISPFHTDLVYAPGGVDLTWVTTVPGPALALWPVTRAFGPLASVNLAMLLAPALAGWAGFLVCRRVTGAFWPSLLGGSLIGFSSYTVGQMYGHVNLLLIFPAVLGVYLVIRRVEGSLGVVPFVAFMTLAIVGLFSISTELVATASLFGGIALLGAWALGDAARGRILRAGLLTGAAYVLAAAILLPILLSAFRNAPEGSVRPPEKASVDLLSFVVPRASMAIGGERYRDVSADFTSNASEDGAYLGLVLVAMLVAFAVTGWRRRETWLLLGFVVVVGLLALGPVLHVRGEPAITLPGALLSNVPLLEHATPQRFSAYLWLPVGVIAAIWLWGARGAWSWPRYAVVVLGAITLLPSVDAPPRGRPIVVPRFISDGMFRDHLEPGEIVFVIPTMKGDEMVWQAEGDFAFRMGQGYIGPIPTRYLGEGLSKGLALHHPSPYKPPVGVVERYVELHRITAFLTSDDATPAFEDLLSEAGWRPEHVADVTVWRLREMPDG
jgi:hypothetical protein